MPPKRLKIEKFDGTVVEGTVLVERDSGYTIQPDDGGVPFFIPKSRVIENLPAVRQAPRK